MPIGRIIDISSNNHPLSSPTIDWGAVASSGVTAVIIKATQGTDYVNPFFAQDLARAQAAGLAVAAYHFASMGDPVAEARAFMKQAGSYARCLDYETNTNVAWARTFVQTLGLVYDQSMIYGSASTLVGFYQQIPAMAWVAAYGQGYPGWGVLWQFTDKASIPGVGTPTDEDQWHGDSSQYDAFFQINIPPEPPPTLTEDDMGFTATDPESGMVIATDANGNFYGSGIGDLHVVTLGQHPNWHAGSAESGGANPCIGITPWKDPQGRWGYAYITRPTSGSGGFGPYDLYHIGRDGTPH